MAIITVVTTVTIDTEKTNEQIFKAIEKGLYWGLDVKNVASPSNVLGVKSVLKTNEL